MWARNKLGQGTIIWTLSLSRSTPSIFGENSTLTRTAKSTCPNSHK